MTSPNNPSFLGFRNAPSRARWDAAASSMNFSTSHQRTSRSMSGVVDGYFVEVVELADSSIIVLLDVSSDPVETIPTFAVQLKNEGESVSGLRQIDTGDLAFEHQLSTFGTKANRVLGYLNLQRRDVLLEVHENVFVDSVNSEGLRATIELEEWEPEQLVDAVGTAIDIALRFFEPRNSFIEAAAS